jgi:hypothetical protein
MVLKEERIWVGAIASDRKKAQRFGCSSNGVTAYFRESDMLKAA